MIHEMAFDDVLDRARTYLLLSEDAETAVDKAVDEYSNTLHAMVLEALKEEARQR